MIMLALKDWLETNNSSNENAKQKKFLIELFSSSKDRLNSLYSSAQALAYSTTAKRKLLSIYSSLYSMSFSYTDLHDPAEDLDKIKLLKHFNQVSPYFANYVNKIDAKDLDTKSFSDLGEAFFEKSLAQIQQENR